MDGWDSWNSPNQPAEPARQTIATALAAAREASREQREIVWDRGMPQESREVISPSDPRWNEAEAVRMVESWMGICEENEDDYY